ncbi:basigin-like [Mytilus trossulus]|uniref:basigin-like n=1 Tax=Mytilus trossulus TaxID=6551 RepID=UPI0030042000
MNFTIFGISVLSQIDKPVVSRKHDLFEEINEGEKKNICCYVDSNTAITSTRWLNGSQEIFITHNVSETSSPTSIRWFKGGQEISVINNATEFCFTIKNVSRYDQGIYTCTAENMIGSGSITTVLQVKSYYQLKENVQPLQSVILWGLLGTIAVLVVGIAILFSHMHRKKKQRCVQFDMFNITDKRIN